MSTAAGSGLASYNSTPISSSVSSSSGLLCQTFGLTAIRVQSLRQKAQAQPHLQAPSPTLDDIHGQEMSTADNQGPLNYEVLTSHISYAHLSSFSLWLVVET